MAQAITNRQEVKQASKRRTMFVKGEKESLAKYNAEGQAFIKATLKDANLSEEQKLLRLSESVKRGFNDFAGNFNTAILWFTLQEAINLPFGKALFDNLERAFYIIGGAGLSATDKKGKNIFNKKESIISITKKESEKGGYVVNIGLKSGFTRSDIAKLWIKRRDSELKNVENIVAFLLGKYVGKPEPQAKPKEEKSLADIVRELELLHDTTSDKKEQAQAKAMLDAYKSKKN